MQGVTIGHTRSNQKFFKNNQAFVRERTVDILEVDFLR